MNSRESFNDNFSQIENVSIQEEFLKIKFKNGDTILFNPNLEVVGDLEYTSDGIYVGDIYYNADKIRYETNDEYKNYIDEQKHIYNIKIGILLKKYRLESNLKLQQSSNTSGINIKELSLQEEGDIKLKFSQIKKLLKVYGKSYSDLSLDNENLSKIKLRDFWRKFLDIGLNKSFLLKKIIPKEYKVFFSRTNLNIDVLISLKEIFKSAFGWNLNNLLFSERLQLSESSIHYKIAKKANHKAIEAYTHYAFNLARILTTSCKIQKDRKQPNDVHEFSHQLSQYGNLNFKNLLEYVWDLGFIVLPLNDSGYFHGACYHGKERNVIILKQKNRVESRWIFDLLHEVYHGLAHGENGSIIEYEEVSYSTDDPLEIEANNFAKEVIFNRSPEELEDLIEECILDVNGYVSKLKKKSVKLIAEKKNLRVDCLAQFVAFRISQEDGHNWWGGANSLSKSDINPYQIAIEKLKENIEWKQMISSDRFIIEAAFVE